MVSRLKKSFTEETTEREALKIAGTVIKDHELYAACEAFWRDDGCVTFKSKHLTSGGGGGGLNASPLRESLRAKKKGRSLAKGPANPWTGICVTKTLTVVRKKTR